MTEEQIEQKAEEYAGMGGLPKEKHFFGVKAQAFIDGYHECQKELEQQIEKMKCCHNCEKYKNKSECESFTRLGFCKKWELRK